MRNKFLLILFLLSIVLISCEKEIGRIDLLKNNSEEIGFKLQKGDVINLYTDIDIEYKEKPLFVYECEFYYDEKILFKGGTDPLLTQNNQKESKVTIDGITHWKFYGKLQGNIIADMAGEYAIKTTFVRNNKPDLKINKAEIVFVK